jgi:hypothetical protein
VPLAAVIVMFDPDMMLGNDDWDRAAPAPHATGDASSVQANQPSQANPSW